MPSRQSKELLQSFRFKLEIAGIETGQFSEISGINSEIDVEAFAEGGRNNRMVYLPSTVKQSRLIIKRGIADFALFDWFNDIAEYTRFRNPNAFKRKSMSVIVYNERFVEKVRWNYSACFPVKWNGPSLNAVGSSIAFESIEFLFDTMRFTRS
jgi:phage tail-like protein